MSRKSIIIDDDEDLCEVLAETLSDLGFEVDIALDAGTGRQFLKKYSYDLILLDLKLPGDGFSILRKIDSAELNSRLFIITGNPINNLPKYKRNLLDKAEDVFIKPFPMTDFLKKIKR
ncbi:MAG: response regulator [Candidatus Krumholzibacteriota bacterium]|nr:response regulator [Candidatus Krumholzibacteriota bacterium]